MSRTEPREITESFRLERVLKSSRSAIVFRAVEPGTGTVVAIKLIPPSSPANMEACRERFLAAAGVLAAAAPEAFPALLDYGFCPDGSAFMVMEIVEGEPFDALAGSSPERVLNLVVSAAEGLKALASGTVAHGNLAPENLVTVVRGGAEGVRILGFGTAAFHGGIPGAGGGVLADGPAQFAAPEALDSATAPAADWRSDLYALAATTCHVLQASVAPADAPAPEVALPPHVRAALADAAALQAILEQSLRRDPAARPASLAEFCAAVNRAVSPAPSAAAAPEAAQPETAPAEPEPAPESATRTVALDVASFVHAGPPAGVAATESAATAPGEDTSPARFRPALPPLPAEPAGYAAPPSAGPSEPFAPHEGAGDEQTDRIRLPHVEASPVEEARAAGPGPAAAEPEHPEQPGPQVPSPSAGRREEPAPPAPVSAAPSAGPAAATAVPSVAPAAAARPEAQPETPAPPAAAPRTRPPHRRRPLVWAAGVGAAIVVAAAAGLFLLWQQQSQRPAPPAPTAAPARPSPTSAPVASNPAVAALERAEAAVALGDLPAAATALDSITSADVSALAPADQGRYNTIKAGYAALRQQSLTKELKRALAVGDMKALADAVRGTTKEEENSFKRDADFRASLEEARRATTVQSALVKAQRRGDQAQVLQSASVLLGIVPKYAAAGEVRENAAAALEREAEALASKGGFDQAIADLETVGRSWPDRPGLQARLERIRGEQESDRKLRALLAQVQQTETDKVPEKGLELLKSVPADPRTAERVAKLRERLTAQLQQLDAQAPTIALAPGFKLEYKKGEAVTLPFKIQDDHGVKGAQLFARAEGSGRYVELPLRHGAGADWTGEISASFHQNRTVEFYAVATDHSGHVGRLGTEKEPIKLKRKKNIFGF